jgi:hypothetical protein
MWSAPIVAADRSQGNTRQMFTGEATLFGRTSCGIRDRSPEAADAVVWS